MIDKKNAIRPKPERLYSLLNLGFDDIKEGDIIPALVTHYNFDERKIQCLISKEVSNTFIKEENFDLLEMLPQVNQTRIPPNIFSRINSIILAQVVHKSSDGCIELNRKNIMKNTFDYLVDNIGNVLTATIERIYGYGAFVDIGNGVQSLLHITNFSKSTYKDLSNLFSTGEQIEVRLLDFDSKTNHFIISRKEAYKTDQSIVGSIQPVRILSAIEDDGFFVEYDPATIGIMDISPSVSSRIQYGDYVYCYIKKFTPKGFKSYFVSDIMR